MASSNVPPAKRRRLNYTNTVIVTVGAGDTLQTFTLHEEILSKKSKYFRALFNGGFKEAKEKVAHVPAEVDPDIFKAYVQWAYTGDIVVIDDGEVDEEESQFRLRLVKLFIAGDFLLDIGLRNAVIDAWIEHTTSMCKGPGTNPLRLAYTSLPENSKLRKVMLDWYLYKAHGDFLEEARDNLPPEFLATLAITWAKAGLNKEAFVKPTLKERCKYHDHDEDVPACGDLEVEKASNKAAATPPTV